MSHVAVIPQSIPNPHLVCGFNYYVEYFVLHQEIRFGVLLVDSQGNGMS